ncbi:MAG: DNA primase, partial [Xanthobacteraceae bacterium]
TLKDAAGRPRRVPGPDPDMCAPAMPVPESVTDLALLADGDSDPFTTRCAIARAIKRHAREGRTVRGVWAPDGKDFDDLNRT